MRHTPWRASPGAVDPARAAAADSTDVGADPNETGLGVSDTDPTTQGQRGVHVPTEEETGTAVDDEERDEGPKGALTFPSSMGMRFQVPRDCGILTVTGTWGRYTSFRRENDEGRKFQWSKRAPVEKTAELDVGDRRQHTVFDPITLDGDVTLRVEVFPRDDRVIVRNSLSPTTESPAWTRPPATGSSRPS